MMLEKMINQLAANYVLISSTETEKVKTYNLMREVAKNVSKGDNDKYDRIMNTFDTYIKYYTNNKKIGGTYE